MTQKLTEKQRAQYLETAQQSQCCPFCKSEDIDSTEPFDGQSQPYHCARCGRLWKDHYTLTGVEEIDS